MIDVFSKATERRFGFLGWTLRRRFPLLARRVRATPKIHAVPELFVHPLARMIEDADESAALSAKPVGNGRHFLLRRFDGRRVVQIHPRIVLSHVIDDEGILIPERLFVQTNVRSFVHVAGDTVRRDADFLQRGDGLRRPGRSGLAVARERFDPENPAHVRCSPTLASRELGDAVQQTAVREIFRRRGMD